MRVIDADKLNDLAAALAAAGYRVIAPQRLAASRQTSPQVGVSERGAHGVHVRFAEWKPGAVIDLDGFPVNSAKEFLFAPSELIGRYTFEGREFQQQAVAPESQKTVLLGVRPCEAAALAVMDAVFNWDCVDSFYAARRADTTVVTVACAKAEENCFCTSVGGSPDSTQGADAMLRPSGSQFIVEPLSDNGGEVLKFAGPIVREGQARPDPTPDVPLRFNREKVVNWLGENFNSPKWLAWSLACFGCGACAYGCPTCHCFDIQDESTRAGGVRYRNWDACGFGLFTLHTSGHNPRPGQAARWRQRVMHKFRYFMEKFGRLACTGCGRCARQCPAGMAILETVKAIDAEK